MKTSGDHHAMPTAKRQRLDPAEIQHHHLKHMFLIYADDHLEENNDDFQKTLVESTSIKDVKLFRNAYDCVQFFYKVETEKVIVVMSGAIKQDLLPKIDSLPQVYAIYLIDEQPICADRWLKVKSVHNNIVSIYKSIEEDIKQYQYQEDDVPVTFASTKNGRLDPSFMYTRLFLQTLFRMEYDKRQLEEFSSFFSRKHADNNVTLEIIKKFPETYRSEEVIKLYTQHSFIYGALNRACRLLEGDIMIHMGFFIRDLYNRIKKLHGEQLSQYNGEPFHLYRGQGMLVEDFENLNSKKGQFTAFNSFLSTSEDKSVARIYAESNSLDQNKIGIIFDITIDPKIKSVSFAKVKGETAFEHEIECLFSMHSVYRIGDIKRLEEDGKIYEVELTLTADDDPELRQLTDEMELELSCLSDDEKLRALSVRLGQDESATERYHLTLRDPDIPWSEKVRCYRELGAIARDHGMYPAALAYLKRAIAIEKRFSSEAESTLELSYQGMGAIYSLMEKHSKALAYYESSLHIRKKHCLSNDPSLAIYYNSIGMTYYEIEKYSDALSHLIDALSIMEHNFGPNHPCLSKIYLSITVVNVAMGNHSEALMYGKKALEIFKSALPIDHPWLAQAHHNIGVTHSAMGETDKALSHYRQVLRIFQKRGSLDPRVLGATYNSIGMIYLRKCNYDGALSKFKDAVETFQSMLPIQDDNLVARAYINIGNAHFDMKEYTNASSYYETALPIFKKTLPDGFDGLGNVYNNLGISYFEMKHYQKSICYFKQALDDIMNTQPNNQHAFVTVFGHMGSACQEMGKYMQKNSYFVEALEIQRRRHLPLHPTLVEFFDVVVELAIEIRDRHQDRAALMP